MHYLDAFIFADYMKKAISIFVDEPDLEPENFIITATVRKDKTYKEKK